MKTVNKGEEIFTSKPFAYALSNKQRGLRCDACLQKKDDLKRCMRCTFMYYCNKACQRSDWQNHKEECINIKRVLRHEPTDFTRLLARVILKLKKPDCVKSETVIGDLSRSFDDLMSHSSEILNDKERMEQFSVFNVVLNSFLGPELVPPTKELLEIFGKLIINLFTITDEEMQHIGVGLYLGASILDHSCCPNAVTIFDGPNVRIHSLTTISDFQISKVFVSYIDILAPIDERRKQLREQYYFDCVCEQCKNKKLNAEMESILCSEKDCKNPCPVSDNTLVTCDACGKLTDLRDGKKLLNIYKSSKSPLTVLKELRKKHNYEKLYQEVSQILPEIGIFHELNVYRIQSHDLAFEACIQLEKWDEAIRNGYLTIAGYRNYYGKSHPIVGIQLMKLGKMLYLIGKFDKALGYLLEAEEIIKLTYMKKHKFYQTLYEYIEMCRAYI